MKSVVCFGDSITWGAIPGSDARHDFEVRWPNALASALEGKARVVENGVNGRTTVHEDPFSPHRNGSLHLPGLLDAHSPFDLLIMMLGTNDLNYCYGGRAFEAMLGMDRLVEIVQHHTYPRSASAPEILVVAPPLLSEPASEPDYEFYFAASITESAQLGSIYKRISDERGCHFFDSASAVRASEIDGCHLDAENTRALGTALAPKVRNILGLS